jgi:polyvinyl alcohol dehydrogenase (cytochrome)
MMRTETQTRPIAPMLRVMALIFVTIGASGQTGSPGWPFAGFDLNNSRWGSLETTVNVSNAGSLVQSWALPVPNDVSATPSVDGSGAVYFPDWSGNLWKVNGATGAVIWRQKVAGYAPGTSARSRTTPTISGNTLIIGATFASNNGGTNGPYLVALNASSGALIWMVQMDPDPVALSTGSPIVYNGIVYAGVSSGGEKETNPTFRGSLLAVSLATGQILWQTYMVPAGYSGGAIWSSTPVIDITRSQIYVTTGNNYLVPESVQQCQQAALGNNPAVLACQAADDYEDSIVALDLATGRVKWGRRCSDADTFLKGCKPIQPFCPSPLGPDYDFGDGAHLFTATINGQPTELVGAGQKSGRYWALNPVTGAVVWTTVVGPGGTVGGMEWGTASDNQRVYVAEANTYDGTYTLEPSGVSWNGGSWAALDAATGAILWQVDDPGMSTVNVTRPALPLAAVTIANGVLYCASMSGAMYALNAATGATLWSFQAPGSVNAAPAVVDGTLYWGSGYHNFPAGAPLGTASNMFYSFALPK